MKGLDTNVLVRFLVQDDEAQALRARRVVETASSHAPLFVPDVVLCETVWVLEVRYKLRRTRIAEVLKQLLFTSQLAFGDRELLERALASYLAGRGDFADYLIRETARAAGCDEVFTFDRALLADAGFAEP